MLTLDTTAVVALSDPSDRHGRAALAVLAEDGGPFIVPAGILAEAAYMLERRVRHEVVDALLEDLQTGRYSLDGGEEDFARIRELASRYADVPLGFADAAVIACAERNGGNVLAFDHDFEVAREGTITLLP